MGKFNKGSFGGDRGGRKFGERSFGGDRGGSRGGFSSGRNDSRPTMHRTTCSECGKSCEVPFRPTGDKPVFCSDCFENHRDGGNDRGNRNFENRNDRGNFKDRRPTLQEGGADYKKELQQINDTLQKILKVLTTQTKSEEGAEVKNSEDKKERKEKPTKKAVDTKALARTIEKVTEKKKTPDAKKSVSKKKTSPKKK